MRTIHHYKLEISDRQAIDMPLGAVPLWIAVVNGDLRVYADVDTTATMAPEVFRVFGTGHALPPGMTYIGSAFVAPFVWHVYRE